MIRILWDCKKFVTQNIKKVFILLLRIIHTYFRSGAFKFEKATFNQILHTLEPIFYITHPGIFLYW